MNNVRFADRQSERLLRAAVERPFPDDGIIGEEFGGGLNVRGAAAIVPVNEEERAAGSRTSMARVVRRLDRGPAVPAGPRRGDPA